jgi:hypothetical protein
MASAFIPTFPGKSSSPMRLTGFKPATAYTAYSPHVMASTLQPGWSEREFDGCIP